MNSICLITLKPNKIWCDFLNLFTKYKIFVIVDDNNFDLSDFISSYKNITFLQIENEKCKMKGYIDTNYLIKKLISGWDKALYYFGIENTNNEFVWFIEDDVFFNNEDTLINIDKQYIHEDLLSNSCDKNIDGNKNSWHWSKINISFSPPYYSGMMCCVRFSKKMINSINDYAAKNNTLFFLEALFPTIAIKNDLIHDNPIEFKNVYYRHNFAKNNINTTNLYHPLKDLNTHISFRI